jgi:hypothetical protein
MGFRVRARDRVGNVGSYSTPATTQIIDTTPPHTIGVAPLPPYQLASFVVSWWGEDLCTEVTSFDVQYRVGAGAWVDWLSQTPDGSDSFDPDSPQCGQTYAFRARAYDEADNVSAWSDGATTTLACHGVSGYVRTVRETPVMWADLSADPAELGADGSDASGFYTLYFSDAGDYDIMVERDRFSTLPARQDIAVSGSVSGIDFYLPPTDDQVRDSGFEAGNWGDWQRGGSNLPALSDKAHTGAGAALLDPGGGDSRLSQTLVLPVDLTDPTLSLMVRLDDEEGPASTLTIQIVGTTTTTEELAVSSGGWKHAWYDASQFAGQPVILTLSVADDPALIVDEVSLGSAIEGVGLAYMPLVTYGD